MTAKRVKRTTTGVVIILLMLCGLVRAAEDGLGTNVVQSLKVDTIDFGSEVRTSWPSESGSFGGGPLDYTVYSNEVVWTPVFRWDGTLQNAQMQVDDGYADVLVVRSAWNATWGTYTTLNSMRVTDAGVQDSTWSSSWVSNNYRIGVIVTNFSTGSNLWWSITYDKD
jgi:hypothetical protein